MSVANGIDRYTDKSGFVVTEISEESNAYKEGIRVGDIIIAYNDTPAENIDAFLRFAETMEPGKALRLKTISFGEEIRNVIRVQEMPAEALKNVTNKALIESSKYYNENIESGIFYISELGIAVKEASPRGLMVMKIENSSPLLGTGIKQGDILLEADRADIYTADNLLENIRNAAMDDFRPMTLFVQGIDNTFYATVKMEQEND